MTTARPKRRRSAPEPTDHRKAAEDALAEVHDSSRSPERSLLAAQVHALLAIEQRLTELLRPDEQSAKLREARAAG